VAILVFGTIILLILAASCFLVTNALSPDAISARQDAIMIESVIASQAQALLSFRAVNPRAWPSAEQLASELPSYANGRRRHYAAAPAGYQWSLYSDEGEVTFCLSATSQPAELSSSTSSQNAPRLVRIAEKVTRERPTAVIQVAAACTKQGVTCAEDQDFCRNDMAEPRVLTHTIKRY